MVYVGCLVVAFLGMALYRYAQTANPETLPESGRVATKWFAAVLIAGAVVTAAASATFWR